MKQIKIIFAVAAVAILTAVVWAAEPSALSSGVFPKYPLQEWRGPTGVVASMDSSGNLTVNGFTTGTTGAVVSATMPLSVVNGGTGQTNVAKAKAALGFQSATAVSGSSSNYTWTFSPAYSAAPVVVASPGQNISVWVSSVTTSNAVVSTTATNVTLYLRAVGAP